MKIAMIGTGYVGLVTGTCLAAHGHHVTCVDVQPDRVAAINRGVPPFFEPGLAELIQQGLAAHCLAATTGLQDAVRDAAMTIIAVGTPDRGREIDLSYVRAAAQEIGCALRHTHGYHTVVVKSTVVPGTTTTLVRQMLEDESGLQAGQFGLCMNPEFLREGSAIADFMEPDRLVIGQWDERSGDALAEVYAAFDCPKVRTTLSNAEMIKYASNALLATLVSFSNELAGLCESLPDTDVDAVMDGLHLDRRLSPMVAGQRVVPGLLSYLKAGAGFGGSCLPKDVNALRVHATRHAVNTPLLDAVMAVNEQRPARVIALLQQALGSLDGQVVAVLGLAFKAGTDDLRDSPSLKVVHELLKLGARVRAYDPLAAQAAGQVFGDRVELYAEPQAMLAGAHAAVVATAWPEFAAWDWTQLAPLMRRPVILDARNALRHLPWPAEVTYRPIGIVAPRKVTND